MAACICAGTAAPVVRKADRGVLRITDGPHQQNWNLDTRQLNAGRLRYWPSSKDVDFQLELFLSRGTAGESMRAINVPIAGAQDSRALTLVIGKQEDQAAKEPPGTLSVARAAGKPLSPLSPDLSELLMPQADTKPFATVEIEVLEFRLKNSAVVPPRALRPVLPTVPPGLRRATDKALVDVKVEIDSSGKVKRAAQVLQSTKPPRALADLALRVSRRWLFEPARMGNRKLPSQVILHYRFERPVAQNAFD